MNPDRRQFSALGSALGFGVLASGLGAALGGCSSLTSFSNPAGGQPLSAPAYADRSKEPFLKPGQAWEFQTVNLYNREAIGKVLHRITRAGPEGIDVELIGEKSRLQERFTQPWKIRQEAHHDGTLWFEQAISLIPSQLTPGYREQQATRYVMLPTRRESLADAVLAEGAGKDIVFRDLFWNQYLEVLGWERISVPAGAFDVARISRRIFFKHFDVFRTQSTRTETLWYAPELGYWVAREWTGQYLTPSGRRRGDVFREDWVRWEMSRRMGPAES